MLIDLLPEAAGDLGSLTPSAQLARLRELVLHATHASSRALRATTELMRIRPPNGAAEALLSASEITAARRFAAIPAASKCRTASNARLFFRTAAERPA